MITGDATQVDLPKGVKSGLAHACNVLEDVRGISIVRFTTEDVVRHPLVGAIVRAYEKAEKAAEAAAQERREAARLSKDEKYGNEENDA